MRVLAVLLLLITVLEATLLSLRFKKIHLQAKLASGRVALKADNGLYLSRCHNCGQAAYQNSAAIYQNNAQNPWDTWGLQIVGNQVAFKSDSGSYLTRCANCWTSASYTDGVFVHVSTLQGNPWSLWTPENLGNGKWAFKGDNGKYLSRCYNCAQASYSDFAFVHVSTPIGNPWSQWTVQYLSKFPVGQINLQADNGNYIARCNKCGSSPYPDSVGVHQPNPNKPWSIWKAEYVGNQVAFKSDNGNYLTRCNKCWASAAYQDAVFAHVSNVAGNPWSLWTPEDLGNGKWALKGDNGNYLSRCNNCLESTIKDFAFVHVSGSPMDNPWSQWTVISR